MRRWAGYPNIGYWDGSGRKMDLCKTCSVELPPDAKNCPSCGRKVEPDAVVLTKRGGRGGGSDES